LQAAIPANPDLRNCNQHNAGPASGVGPRADRLRQASPRSRPGGRK